MDSWITRGGVVALFCLAIADAAVWVGILGEHNPGAPELFFLDVGQGDAALARLSGGVDVLIDGGPPNGRALSALADVLSPYDRYIDLVVISHPQLDHFGGLIDVADRYGIGAVIGNGEKNTSKTYRAFEEVLAEAHVPSIALGAGDRIRAGDALFTILSPARSSADGFEIDPNDRSLVFRLEARDASAIFTGDATAGIERAVALSGLLRSDILKVAHHGSRFSSTREFLAAVAPIVSVVSVGANSYGHPSPEAIDRITSAGSRIFRTDEYGTIKVSWLDGLLNVFTSRTPPVDEIQ